MLNNIEREIEHISENRQSNSEVVEHLHKLYTEYPNTDINVAMFNYDFTSEDLFIYVFHLIINNRTYVDKYKLQNINKHTYINNNHILTTLINKLKYGFTNIPTTYKFDCIAKLLESTYVDDKLRAKLEFSVQVDLYGFIEENLLFEYDCYDTTSDIVVKLHSDLLDILIRPYAYSQKNTKQLIEDRLNVFIKDIGKSIDKSTLDAYVESALECSCNALYWRLCTFLTLSTSISCKHISALIEASEYHNLNYDMKDIKEEFN